MVMGCGGEKLPRVPVSGKATLDGQPILLAQILFVALPDDVTSIRPQSAGQIKDGNFQIKPSFGPVPGAQLARIVLLKETTVQPDPSSETQQAGVQLEEVGSITVPIEIPENGTNELNFDLNSKDMTTGEASSGV